MYSRRLRNRYTWLLVLGGGVGLALFGVAVLSSSGDQDAIPEAIIEAIPFGQVLQDAQEGRIDLIEVDGTNLRITYLDSDESGPVVKRSKIGPNVDLEAFLLENGISTDRNGSTSDIPAVDLRKSTR